MNEREQFKHFMTLANAYHERHPTQEHFFNYFQYVPIDLLIAILEDAHGRIVRMDCENAKGKVGFKGFSYVLPSDDLGFVLLSLSGKEVDSSSSSIRLSRRRRGVPRKIRETEEIENV